MDQTNPHNTSRHRNRKPTNLCALFCSCFLLLSSSLSAQDTVSVFFPFGSAKLASDQQEVLHQAANSFALEDLDSVHFVGFADSVGNARANKKLSERRAMHVVKLSRAIFPKAVPTKMDAVGEQRNRNEQQNRRVDVVFYFPDPPELAAEEKEEDVPTEEAKPFCVNIDYVLLSKGNVRTFRKGQKEYVIIEVFEAFLMEKKEHYYGYYSKQGNFVRKKVRWRRGRVKQTKTTSWNNSRLIAQIPKAAFDQFKIFKTSDLPCDECNEDVTQVQAASNETTCEQQDFFLMRNLQFKRKVFSRGTSKIRVPKQYVDPNATYYIGCGKQKKLEWETKKGKRKGRYLYTDLPHKRLWFAYIVKEMPCCESQKLPDCQQQGGTIRCGTRAVPDTALYFSLEAGANLMQQSLSPFVGIGFHQETRRVRISSIVGTDEHLGLYGSARYQVHWANFRYRTIGLNSGWHAPGDRIAMAYPRLYAGAELKTSQFHANDYLEANVHLGIASVDYSKNSWIPRIFLQGGLAYDYLQNNATGIYPTMQFGLLIHLKRLKD